jgi:hypothetical protein
MPTRKFPTWDLLAVARSYDEPVTGEDGTTVYTLVEDRPTGETPDGTDDLGEWHLLVFEVEGVCYRCWYIDGNAEWNRRSGEAWDDHFVKARVGREHRERYTLDDDRMVECEAVYKRPVMTYEWEALPKEGDGAWGSTILTPIDTPCYACGKLLPEGSAAAYVVGKGCRHETCPG